MMSSPFPWKTNRMAEIRENNIFSRVLFHVSFFIAIFVAHKDVNPQKE